MPIPLPKKVKEARAQLRRAAAFLAKVEADGKRRLRALRRKLGKERTALEQEIRRLRRKLETLKRKAVRLEDREARAFYREHLSPALTRLQKAEERRATIETEWERTKSRRHVKAGRVGSRRANEKRSEWEDRFLDALPRDISWSAPLALAWARKSKQWQSGASPNQARERWEEWAELNQEELWAWHANTEEKEARRMIREREQEERAERRQAAVPF